MSVGILSGVIGVVAPATWTRPARPGVAHRASPPPGTATPHHPYLHLHAPRLSTDAPIPFLHLCHPACSLSSIPFTTLFPTHASTHRSGSPRPGADCIIEVHCSGSPTRPVRVYDLYSLTVGRSPPIASPVHRVPNNALPLATEEADSEDTSDGSEEEVDFDRSSFHADSLDPLAGGEDDITWMPPGDMERAGKVAYAYININGPSNNPAPFIHEALFSGAPTVHCTLHPSSRGVGV